MVTPRSSTRAFARPGFSDSTALMFRLREETNDPIVRKRVLDIIDEMIRAGFYGIDEQLKNRYDR